MKTSAAELYENTSFSRNFHNIITVIIAKTMLRKQITGKIVMKLTASVIITETFFLLNYIGLRKVVVGKKIVVPLQIRIHKKVKNTVEIIVIQPF